MWPLLSIGVIEQCESALLKHVSLCNVAILAVLFLALKQLPLSSLVPLLLFLRW